MYKLVRLAALPPFRGCTFIVEVNDRSYYTVCAERGWIESDRIQQLRILLRAALTLVDDVVANVMA